MRPAAHSWFATGLALAAVGAPAAQQRPPADPLIVLVHDPAQLPVTGATALLVGEPVYELLALRGFAHRRTAAAVEPGWQATAVSDEKGVVRFARGEAAVQAGVGVIHTEQGLGALLPRLRAGRAERITLQPMALVTTSSGSEEFRLLAHASLPGGERLSLPERIGTQHRLPAGSYELWAHSRDGWIWQRLDLRSGQRAMLSFDGPAQSLSAGRDVFVHPAGRPEVDLLAADGTALLRGACLSAPLITHFGNEVLGARVLPAPPTKTPIRWPPTTAAPTNELRLDQASATTPAALFVVHGTARGDFEVRAAVMADGGTFQLPTPEAGDAWFLLVARDRPAQAWPVSQLASGAALSIPAGQRLVIEARDARSLPVDDLVVEYVPAAAAPATVITRTDARGVARFGPALAPGVVRISDARFGNLEVALPSVPTTPLALIVDAGARLAGRVRLDNGEAARGVLLTLRDPRGTLRPATRTALTDQDGAFTFVGLPDEVDLVLFATTQRNGRTWSGRLSRVRAGDDAVVVLRDEDPAPELPRER